MRFNFASIRNHLRKGRGAIAMLAILQCALATVAVAAEPAEVSVRWAQPTASAFVSGKIQLRLTGQNFRNVEIFRDQIMIARAKVSADGNSATAVISTYQFVNGPVTLTAHAWNGSAGESFTSEADAGARRFTVKNSGRLSNTRELLGVFVGNKPAGVVNFEAWLGRQVDGILGYTGDANWTDYDGSVGWAAHSVWGQIDRPVFWSIPLLAKGATLAEAATGAYNEHYRKAAEILVRSRPTQRYMYIRTGWEFNADWMHWSAIGKEKEFIGAYRQFVTTYRAVAKEHGVPGKFIFEWNVAHGNHGMNPAAAYPGNAYVDIIGMDFYLNPTYDLKDPIAAWEWKVNCEYGLKWHQTFAAAHGKRTSYSEWGVRGDNAGPFIERAHAWFKQNAVVFHTYWDSNSAFAGKLSSEQYPTTSAEFYEEFHTP